MSNLWMKPGGCRFPSRHQQYPGGGYGRYRTGSLCREHFANLMIHDLGQAVIDTKAEESLYL